LPAGTPPERIAARSCCGGIDHGAANTLRHESSAGAAKSRGSFHPLRPDLDKFLFAEVEDETDEMPLSVISALTRLGLDPWEEAGRLSSLRNREAVEQLARLIAELPGNFHPLREAREIASTLVPLLPNHNSSPTSALQVQIRPRYCKALLTLPKLSQFWVACFVLAAAAVVSALLHGGFPFVGTKEEAKQQAKTLARSLGLKVYGIVDKSGMSEEPGPWLVPGVGKSF